MIHVLAPVLDRPHRVAPLIESLEASQVKAQLRLTFVLSPGDDAELEAVLEAGADHIVAPFPPAGGDWARKINLATSLIGDAAEWFLLGADDLRFRPGWADAALRCARASEALVIGTEDLGNREARKFKKFSTHPMVHRSYVGRGVIDAPGLLLNEQYDHNFPDRELAEYAARQGLWHYCDAAVVEHLHPGWGKGENDWVYQKGVRNFIKDQRVFHRRRRLWHGGNRVYARRRMRI